jgi:hypothetical protein
MAEIYVSTDVETDGPIPGPHSMLSFASAAYQSDKTLVSTFAANLETLNDASGDPKTMDWWATQSAAWDACRRDPQPARDHGMPFARLQLNDSKAADIDLVAVAR